MGFPKLIQSVIIFSSSNSRKNMIYHIFCLIKKSCKVSKFAKFMLVISLFKYSRKNFLDRFLNLPRGMTCLQNIFFNVDFLIYFEFFLAFLRFSDISIEPMYYSKQLFRLALHRITSDKCRPRLIRLVAALIRTSC